MPQSLPDAEILARTWALSKTSITDIVDQKVATRLPQDADMPFLVITRLGGTPLSGEALIDEALLQLDCYAGKYATNNTKGQPDYATAYNLASAIVAEAFDQSPEILTSSGGVSGKLSGFTIQNGPQRIDEPELGLARYTIDIVMIYGAK
jgi:hypothetical protein